MVDGLSEGAALGVADGVDDGQADGWTDREGDEDGLADTLGAHDGPEEGSSEGDELTGSTVTTNTPIGESLVVVVNGSDNGSDSSVGECSNTLIVVVGVDEQSRIDIWPSSASSTENVIAFWPSGVSSMPSGGGHVQPIELVCSLRLLVKQLPFTMNAESSWLLLIIVMSKKSFSMNVSSTETNEVATANAETNKDILESSKSIEGPEAPFLEDLIVGAFVDLIVGALVDLIVGAFVDLIVGAFVDFTKAASIRFLVSSLNLLSKTSDLSTWSSSTCFPFSLYYELARCVRTVAILYLDLRKRDR